MSKAYKCDICGSLFANITNIYLDKNKPAYLELCGSKYDVCPDCINAIQSTIDSLNPSNNVDSVTIGCNTCKFGPVNTVDYMRCHKCTGYNLWEAKG